MRDGSRLAFVGVAVTLLAGCAGGTSTAGGAPTTTAPASSAVSLDLDGPALMAALCAARAQADPAAAAGTFANDAHGPLHDLAREVAEADRAVAARLHESKQAAEAVLDGGDATEIGARLEELTAATRMALETLGQDAPGCEEQR